MKLDISLLMYLLELQELILVWMVLQGTYKSQGPRVRSHFVLDKLIFWSLDVLVIFTLV